MSVADHVDLEQFMAGVERRNPGETEFIQAVREVAEDIYDFMEDKVHYHEAQILRRIAKKAMNISGDNGLKFYDFDEIKDPKEFKLKYSRTLNSLPIDQEMADLIVEEANLAFKYNMDMFKELEGNLIAVIGKLLFSFFTKKSRIGSTESH